MPTQGHLQYKDSVRTGGPVDAQPPGGLVAQQRHGAGDHVDVVVLDVAPRHQVTLVRHYAEVLDRRPRRGPDPQRAPDRHPHVDLAGQVAVGRSDALPGGHQLVQQAVRPHIRTTRSGVGVDAQHGPDSVVGEAGAEDVRCRVAPRVSDEHHWAVVALPDAVRQVRGGDRVRVGVRGAGLHGLLD